MSALLPGRTALVTGAGGRLGRAICATLAREGARVACADLTEEAAGAALAAAGGAGTAVAGDVADEAVVVAPPS